MTEEELKAIEVRAKMRQLPAVYPGGPCFIITFNAEGDDTLKLCEEVRRLQNAVKWQDAILLRVCDHAHELMAEIREGREKAKLETKL